MDLNSIKVETREKGGRIFSFKISFSTKHIKNICEDIPHLAEQVVIFIKDTDGEIAEKYLSEKIGKKHRFVKMSETETVLE